MYRNGFSPSVWKVVEALDKEKMEVLKAIGAEPQSYFDKFLFRTFENHEEYTPIEGFKNYADTSSPGLFL